MNYWKRRSKHMTVLSIVLMVSYVGALFLSAVYVSIMLMMFSLHLKQEGEICELKYANNVLARILGGETAEKNKE